MPLSRMSVHLPPVDVLLGGPLTEYERLARASKLEPLEGKATTFWSVARRSEIERQGTLGEWAEPACPG